MSHIDDFLHAGNEEFDVTVMSKLKTRFVAGKVEERQFTYVGFQMVQKENGILLEQTHFVDGINKETMSAQRSMQKEDQLSSEELTMLRSIVGKLNWAVQGSRPDLAFEVIELSTKFQNGSVKDLVRAMKAVRKLKESRSEVFFPNLGPSSEWKIVLFSDAAHANLSDGVSSTGAHVIFLSVQQKVCPLSWKANKIKRVVRSTISAEALSLQVGLEEAVYLRNMIVEILNIEAIPITAYVDNKSVVEAVHSTKMVDDKRLCIDIAAIKQSLENGEVGHIGWCPGVAQLANCMTKKGASGLPLLEVFQEGWLKS